MKRMCVALSLLCCLLLLPMRTTAAQAPALPSAPAATAAPAAKEQAPARATVTTLQARSNLVIVDVVVTDKAHNPVHGLKQTDFQLSEGKTAQAIKSFEEHTPAAAAAVKLDLPPGVFTNFMAAPDGGPVNIVLIDRLNTPLQSQGFLHDQLIKFVKGLKPGTKLAIFGLNTQLIYLQGFTTDPKLLLGALEAKKNLPRPSPLLETGQESSMSDTLSDMGASAEAVAGAEQFEAQYQSFATQLRARYTLDAMNSLARYLSTIPGRKNLVWFSGAFPISILPDGDLTDPFAAMADMEDEFRETTNLLSRAQVAVYPIDARGLQGLASMDASVGSSGMSKYRGNPGAFAKKDSDALMKTATEQMTMREMAHETGGEAYVNTNGLAEAVTKAIDNGSSYYTLTYSPGEVKADGSWRKIEVSTTAANATLSYRRGYYTDTPPKPERRQLTVSAAAPGATAEHQAARNSMLRGVPQATQIVFKVFVSPEGPATETALARQNYAPPATKPPYRNYTVNYAASPRDLSFRPLGGGKYGIDLEFLAFVYDAQGTLANSIGQTLRGTVSVDDVKAMLKAGLQFHQVVSVPAKGDYFLRIGVHDLLVDHIGAVEIPVDAVKNLPVVAPPESKPAAPKLSDLPK